MRFVVDSNVLFTFFWKTSVSHKLFQNSQLELFSPEFALEEIKKYSEDIMKKAKISKGDFNSIRKKLVETINFISIEKYAEFLSEAYKISPDKNDVDFVALSLKLRCSIWSNDAIMKNQTNFKVLNTKEVIELLY